MDCLRCGRGGAVNRIVVERETGAELGVLCEACERSRYGIALRDSRWHHARGCAVCTRDGAYSLPLLDFVLETSAVGRPDAVEYEITDGTVELCDRHVRPLTSAAPNARSIRSVRP